MPESTQDSWREYWSSNGTFGYDADRTEKTVYDGQNRLLEKVAQTLDEIFPPEEFGKGWGTGCVSPGDVVRQFIVKPEQKDVAS